LFLCLHTVYVTHESGGAAEELTHGGAVINGWGVRVEGCPWRGLRCVGAH
jgi:hypothetical protein